MMYRKGQGRLHNDDVVRDVRRLRRKWAVRPFPRAPTHSHLDMAAAQSGIGAPASRQARLGKIAAFRATTPTRHQF